MAQIGLDRELLTVQCDYRVRRRQGEIYSRAQTDFRHKDINGVDYTGDYCRAEEQIYRNSYPSRHALESQTGEKLRDYKHGEERRREQNGRLEGRCDRDYRAEARSLNEHGVMNERAAEQRVGE